MLDLQPAAEGFDARRSALSRRYRYLMLRGRGSRPAAAPTPPWHVPNALDVPAMRLAADTVLGTHDFSAFCRRRPGGGSLERHVTTCGVSGDDARLLRFEIEANAFCHQMVRSIIGALVSVGEGSSTAAGMIELLRARGSVTWRPAGAARRPLSRARCATRPSCWPAACGRRQARSRLPDAAAPPIL